MAPGCLGVINSLERVESIAPSEGRVYHGAMSDQLEDLPAKSRRDRFEAATHKT